METAISDIPRCTCRINHPFGSMEDAEIIYCPLHAAAEEMYEALERLIDCYVRQREDDRNELWRNAITAKTKADGRQ